MRSKLSITVYLFFALYGSTTLQSQSFLKNIKNFLCKQKSVNNCSIPSMHAERKITVCSHKHSFTPYLSLSPYSPTDRITDKGMNTFAARGLEELFVQLCCRFSFLVLARNRFWVYILKYLEYNTVVSLCQFFGSGGKQFQVFHTYVLSVQYTCAVVSVFWLWREIVLNMRTPFYFL